MAERAWGSNSLIGIIRQDEINRAINNDISGLKWAERMGIRREQAVLKINETIVQGLHNGETYRQMAERLNEAVGKDVPNAIRIVRTETYRVFHEARKDRLDRIDGITMTKEWIAAKDEAVRSNHRPMHGIRVPYHEDFILPNKNQGFGPGMIGDPADDINCRCFYVVDEAGSGGGEISVDYGGDDGIIGVEGEGMELLPNYKNAVMPEDKFKLYSLNPDRQPDKATAFRGYLGYTEDNYHRLMANIRYNLDQFPAVPKGHNGWGELYECKMHLRGANGNTADVITAWIVRDGEDFPRLTSTYVKE